MFAQDKSNYLRGLLLLAAIDRSITEEEKQFIVTIGNKLGFEKEFCFESVEGVLHNEYIDQEIPVFSNILTAGEFLHDCYELALCDDELTLKEVSWLALAAIKNNPSFIKKTD